MNVIGNKILAIARRKEEKFFNIELDLEEEEIDKIVEEEIYMEMMQISIEWISYEFGNRDNIKVLRKGFLVKNMGLCPMSPQALKGLMCNLGL